MPFMSPANGFNGTCRKTRLKLGSEGGHGLESLVMFAGSFGKHGAQGSLKELFGPGSTCQQCIFHLMDTATGKYRHLLLKGNEERSLRSTPPPADTLRIRIDVDASVR
ncbi:uncharacterized protein LOC114754233 [Neltuma alba]|uniref:uncharacterized protein LOC114754233 n=1 Tax=Neltuma alba TaxID=207710 RepID=UPI0010A3782E|nr:uncharacterized protein LOC114754233 [Prosopis alba]